MTTIAISSVSYTIPNAAKATGVGQKRLIEACDTGDLECHWNGANRILRAIDLDEWIQTLPTERPR